MKRFTHCTGWFLVLAFATAWSCEQITGPVPVHSISIASDSVQLMEGDTLRLATVLRNEHGTRLSGRMPTWTSFGAHVAVVDSMGLLSALSGGVTQVVAEADGLRDTVEVRVLVPFRSIGAGATQSCGIHEGGQVLCWGTIRSGFASDAPVQISGPADFDLISAGGRHGCGIGSTGETYCWGDNSRGQLGDESWEDRAQASLVHNLKPLVQISAGWAHSCGVDASGIAYCWGDNSHLQLGTDSTENTCRDGNGTEFACWTKPEHVDGDHIFRSIAAGVDHTCALTLDSNAYCWGLGASGRLGTDSTYEVTGLPRKVSGNHRFRSVTVGSAHTCGLTTTGAAYCWGDNTSGQLGTGTADDSRTPAAVARGLILRVVSAGGHHTCGLTSDGVVFCWGDNSRGQLGNGNRISSSVPVPVAGSTQFELIAAGGEHTCGITESNLAFCWGDNRWHQLGSSAEQMREGSDVPVPVSG